MYLVVPGDGALRTGDPEIADNRPCWFAGQRFHQTRTPVAGRSRRADHAERHPLVTEDPACAAATLLCPSLRGPAADPDTSGQRTSPGVVARPAPDGGMGEPARRLDGRAWHVRSVVRLRVHPGGAVDRARADRGDSRSLCPGDARQPIWMGTLAVPVGDGRHRASRHRRVESHHKRFSGRAHAVVDHGAPGRVDGDPNRQGATVGLSVSGRGPGVAVLPRQPP